MLCLSRKRGQSIVINKDIHVMILSNDRGVVRLGITAPRDVSVDRAEVHDQKKKEN